ncbi:uncharacterized protein TNCV_610851 [Trichonephila clavipes]|nr:uncharacterized protein TNCV_610851 [Trichonephila clavipes]
MTAQLGLSFIVKSFLKALWQQARTLTGHDFLQQHLHRVGVKDTPDCPLCLSGLARNFVHLTVCASLANPGFNFSSDNFPAKVGLYWAARRKMAYTAHSSA